MKRLTDKNVARALHGFAFVRDCTIPRYTSSLDAIVAEIEARGLVWHCDTTGNGPNDLKRAWAWLKK